jgi:hypothetical protein
MLGGTIRLSANVYLCAFRSDRSAREQKIGASPTTRRRFPYIDGAADWLGWSRISRRLPDQEQRNAYVRFHRRHTAGVHHMCAA